MFESASGAVGHDDGPLLTALVLHLDPDEIDTNARLDCEEHIDLGIVAKIRKPRPVRSIYSDGVLSHFQRCTVESPGGRQPWNQRVSNLNKLEQPEHMACKNIFVVEDFCCFSPYLC